MYWLIYSDVFKMQYNSLQFQNNGFGNMVMIRDLSEGQHAKYVVKNRLFFNLKVEVNEKHWK